ncbi:MAG: hypothetical protein U0T77_04980 [Chitinophagales bacterium]
MTNVGSLPVDMVQQQLVFANSDIAGRSRKPIYHLCWISIYFNAGYDCFMDDIVIEATPNPCSTFHMLSQRVCHYALQDRQQRVDGVVRSMLPLRHRVGICVSRHQCLCANPGRWCTITAQVKGHTLR